MASAANSASFDITVPTNMPQASLLNYFSTPVTNPPHASDSISRFGAAELSRAAGNINLDGQVPEKLVECDNTLPSQQNHGGSTPAFLKSQLSVGEQSPPSGITISTIELHHIPALKRLTSSMLPVKYPDLFFTEVVHDTIPAELSRVAVFENKAIGWIRCRLEPGPEQPLHLSSRQPQNQIYIQALCLLAPHRGHGIASLLLQSVFQSDPANRHDVGSVYAHVWENNVDAREWYERRGFKQIMMIESYYRKLKPGGAWLMRKELKRE